MECTHARDVGPKSVKGLIDKISGIRDELVKAVHTHYGREKKLKIKCAIAIRNIELREADKARAQAAGIPIISDNDINYFNRLVDILKSAARYQFLGRYLSGEKVEGLRTKVPATRGRAGKTTFYNFLISPHELLRVSYISHMAKSSNDDLHTYQRMVKPARLKSIGRYIDDGGTFPTNIVINFKRDDLQFDPRENFGETATGILSLPGQYGSAWVIDGQHRLYGYAYANRKAENDHSSVSVLAYENLPIRQEIELFVDINTQQVKVSRNLVNEIVSSLNVEDPDLKKRLEAMCARVAMRLDSYAKSPIKNRILTVAEGRTRTRCLTLTSLADGIDENHLLGTLHRNTKGNPPAILPGPLADPSVDAQATMSRAIETISHYLMLFSEPLETHWELGDDKGGYLCTNLGIRALLQLLRRLIAFVEVKENVRAITLKPDDLVDRLRPYVASLTEYFKTADVADIARFRNRGSSLQSVDQNCFQMMVIINEKNSTFDTQELRNYIESQDAEGTKQARDMIDEINRILFHDVISTLKNKFGDTKDIWWHKGVPKTVRNECDKQFNEQPNDSLLLRDRWQFMYLINYLDIVLFEDNWDIFKDYYNFYGKGKKADLVRWIIQVNKARQVTHHAEKGPLSRDEVEFVRKVHALVKEHIEHHQPVDQNKRYLPT